MGCFQMQLSLVKGTVLVQTSNEACLDGFSYDGCIKGASVSTLDSLSEGDAIGFLMVGLRVIGTRLAPTVGKAVGLMLLRALTHGLSS
jgi:hypothetical protein